MNWHVAGLHRLDRLIWAIITAVAVIVLVTTWTTSFHMSWASFAIPGAVAAVFLVGQHFYQTRRQDHRLAAALGGTAQLMAFAIVGAPLSYICASFDFPLHDHWLDAVDRALGFDWSSWLSWMDAHATVHPLFFLAYFSLMPQTAIAVLVLSFTGHLAWLRTYMLAFLITTLVTIGVAAVIPTEGAWGLYKLNPSAFLNITPAVQGEYLPIFNGLRDGTFRLLTATGSEGIITFPSLHAALGLLLTAALWPISILRWISLALNVLMIFSIPVDGGHYFLDILAGLAIAWNSLTIARAVVNRAHEPFHASAGTGIGLVPGK